MLDPRTEAELLWFFNLAPDELQRMRSLQSGFEAEMEARSLRGQHARELRCGPVFVGSDKRHVDPHADFIDERALHAAAKERRIRRALEDAGETSAHILRLRYREILPVCRMPFGCVGGVEASFKRGRAPLKDAVARTLLRGAGNVAHLTPTARAAHRWSRSTRKIGAWLDRLGAALCAKAPSPKDRALGAEVRREAEQLVNRAVDAYRARRRMRSAA